MASCEIELWACVDDEGQYEVGTTEEEAREKYEENIGALNERAGHRMVSLVVTVPAPEAISLTCTAPAEEAAAVAVA